jgi:hypothetical protein
LLIQYIRRITSTVDTSDDMVLQGVISDLFKDDVEQNVVNPLYCASIYGVSLVLCRPQAKHPPLIRIFKVSEKKSIMTSILISCRMPFSTLDYSLNAHHGYAKGIGLFGGHFCDLPPRVFLSFKIHWFQYMMV